MAATSLLFCSFFKYLRIRIRIRIRNYRGRWVPCHFAFPISIFQLSFPFSALQLPFSTFQPRKQTPWHLQAGCRPIMHSVRGIYRPGDQPTVQSVLIIRHLQGGSWPTDRVFFNFPISNLESGLCGIYRLGG